mgnify:CR=1 FL=1
MTENGSAKRVIIKKDAETLADYVATRKADARAW